MQNPSTFKYWYWQEKFGTLVASSGRCHFVYEKKVKLRAFDMLHMTQNGKDRNLAERRHDLAAKVAARRPFSSFSVYVYYAENS